MTGLREDIQVVEPKEFDTLLRRNIAFPFVLSLLTGATYIGLTLYVLNSNRWVDHTNRVIAEASQILTMSVDAETSLRGYLLTGRQEYLDLQLRSRAQRGARLTKLREMVQDNVAQLGRLDQIEKRLAVWADYCDRQKELKLRGNTDFLKPDNMDRGRQAMDEVRENFQQFVTAEEELRLLRTQSTQTAVRWALALTGLLSLIAGGLLAVLGRRQLFSLSDRFTEGLRTQVKLNSQLEVKNWMQAGQARLADDVRGLVTLPEICERALSVLANYTGASVGRLFVGQETGVFIAEAGFAFDERKSSAAQSYLPGQGLVGEALKQGEQMELANVPGDYMGVSSSLGGMNVQHLIITPAVLDGVAKAVIELGYRTTPAPRVRMLLEQAAERLAYTIKSAQYRIRTQELLEETQRQAEELQSQQEELESNNEDLQQKAQELLAQQHNLEQSNAELEQQQTQLEEQKERLEEANRELVRVRNEIREKAQGLEVASKYKSEFLANMSHELRTPLNSILLLSNLLAENNKKGLDREDVEYANTIHTSASDLLNLINDILDLSKVEAGKLDISGEKTSTADLVESLRRTFAPQMEKKGLQLAVAIDNDVTSTVHSDRARIEQILRNFLSNSLKFTEKGSITLKLFSPGTQDSEYAVGISVIDTGIGIPQSKQRIIFDAFQQADGTISRKFGGTGLGLTISRELARLLGGKITVESSEGTGSTFTLYLPDTLPSAGERSPEVTVKPEPEAAAAPVPTRRPAHGIEDDRKDLTPADKPILIIEDDPTFAKLVCNLVKRKGYKCLLASEGENGLADAIHFMPHAIILDVNLPGISGMGVLDSLKRNSRTRHIPVHVLSVEQNAKNVLRMGAVGFDVKPITEQALEQLIDKMGNLTSKATKKILLVEDNLVEQQNVRKLIGNGDVKIEAVTTGKDALAALQAGDFDCIILDLKLPDITGFDLLAQIRETIRSAPPVIVYTARDLSREEQTRLNELSDSIVLKGVRSPDRLLDEVTLFLHKMEEKLTSAQRDLLQKVRHREELFQNKKVLVVDDDMRNVFALRSVLLKKGFQVAIAKTGQEALDRLEEVPDVNLILMDVMMPEMDGLEAMRRIRQDTRFKAVPIIALTAKAMKGDREKCMRAGASDYLPKPVDMPSLLSLLRIWLTR